MVQTGAVDGAFNVTKQQSTIEKFSFGNVPLLKANASFFYHNDSKLDFKSINDVPTGTTVALILDYEYGDTYEQNKHRFEEVRVSNQSQIIQLIQLKRVDFAIMFDAVAKHHLNLLGLSASDIHKGSLNHTSDIFVAFNKQKSNSKLISLLDQGLLKTQ